MSRTKSNSNVRIHMDDYPTPDWCVELICDEIKWDIPQSFLEPCAGDGRINRIVKEYGRSDLDIMSCEIQDGCDYLTTKFDNLDLIVTNPPFSKAQEFLEKSLSEADCVIYLLRLNYLGSLKRYEFWNKNPASHIFVLTPRPSFVNGGTDATEYAWFVWENDKGIMDKYPGVYVLKRKDENAD